MKKAFTLVELLVVVVVISIMLTMVVRFGNIGEDSQRRTITISRIQRLENALSGYYAAFGTYPPVKLHGSRDIYRRVTENGVQDNENPDPVDLKWGWLGSDGKVKNGEAESSDWMQVRAACVSQPVCCNFPYPDDEGFRAYVKSYSDGMKSYADQAGDLSSDRKAVFAAGFDTGVSAGGSAGRFDKYRDLTDWNEIQLFRFGLLSYLLPRYLFMMEGAEDFLEYAQWEDNNKLPGDPLTGEKRYRGMGTSQSGWQRMRKDAGNSAYSPRDYANVANIPSQAVCARWITNFEGSLTMSRRRDFFGVNVYADPSKDSIEGDQVRKELEIYRPGNDESRVSEQYILDSISMCDGWYNDFYYYSDPPYQSYVLWSAGPNGKTFPPWISREALDADANKCVEYWMRDDIVGQRH